MSAYPFESTAASQRCIKVREICAQAQCCVRYREKFPRMKNASKVLDRAFKARDGKPLNRNHLVRGEHAAVNADSGRWTAVALPIHGYIARQPRVEKWESVHDRRTHPADNG